VVTFDRDVTPALSEAAKSANVKIVKYLELLDKYSTSTVDGGRKLKEGLD